MSSGREEMLGRNGPGGAPPLAAKLQFFYPWILLQTSSFGLCFPGSVEISWWKGLNAEFVVTCFSFLGKASTDISAVALLLQPGICLNHQFKASIAEISKQQKFSNDPS